LTAFKYVVSILTGKKSYKKNMPEKMSKPLTIGSKLPNIMGRTDEGTPIALSDFKGRTIALFLLGTRIERIQEIFLRNIKKRLKDFLEMDCSPIVISGESHKILTKYQKNENLLFLLISDADLRIHSAINGAKNSADICSWIANDEGEIAAMIPSMPPREQVNATLAALVRVSSERVF
jgi:peroxiredoxin